MPNPNRKKRSIWFWLLMTCIVLAIVGLPTGYFGLRYYIKQRIIGWRAEGMAAAAAGNNEKAAQYLTLYIQRRPEDLPALEAFIKVREQVEMANGQHIRLTVDALKMILGLDPTRIDDRRHLLRLYARMQRRPEALDTANAILAKLPKDVETLEIKTDVLMGMEESREALATVEQWIAIVPEAVPAQMKRIDIRLRLGQPLDGVIKDVQKLADAKPKDPGAELLLGYALLHAGEQKQQEAAMWLRNAARDVDPKSPLVKIIVAQFDTLGVSADAIAVLQDLVDRGAASDVRHTLACRYWEQGKWQKCVEMLADVNPADPNADAGLLAFKEIALANLSKSEEAAACRAALAQKKNSLAQAWMLILPRVTSAADVNDQRIAEACRQAMILRSQDPYLQYYLGDAYARMGELDLAIDAWRQATAFGPTWDMPASRLVEALLQKGKPELALRVAISAQKRSPTSASATVALARAWAVGLETGDASHAEGLLQLAEFVQSQIPGEEQTLLIQVRQQAKKGNAANAVAAIRAALARNPAHREQVLVSLAAISREFKLGVEDEVFAATEKAHGASPGLGYARAANAFLGGDAAKGLEAFDKSAANAGRSGDAAMWKLARARYLDVTNNAGALEAWKALQKEFPDNLSVQTAVAAARAVAGNREIMQPSVERLKELSQGKGLEWRLAEGRMLVQCAQTEDDYVKSSLVLSNLCKDFPGLPEGHALLARALVRMNRIEGAIEHLQTASLLEPNSVPYAVELAALLQSRGEFDRVRMELDRIAPRLRSDEEKRMAAMVLMQAGATDKAVALMEQTPAGAQTAPSNTLFMAMVYRKHGQLDKAEGIVKGLLEKPDLATVQFAAGLYLELGRRTDAEKALALLDNIKLEPALKEMIWGAYYLQTNKPAEAITQYQAAVKQAPANAVTWRTLSAVYMILGAKNEAMEAIREGAKTVPMDKGLQAESGQVDLLREALDDPGLAGVVLLYHRNPLAGDAPLELMRLVTDARRANDMQRLAARLQQFIERHTDFMPAYIRLAQCFSEMGRANDALTAAQHAMNVFPSDPEPARIATQVAAVSQKWSDMRSAAEAWKKRSNNDPNADVALARALTGLGQYEAARNQLRAYVAAAQSNPEQYAAMLSVYAGATVNIGRESEAIDLLWPLAQKDPRWRGLWVDTSLLFKDAKETIAWLDKVEAAIPVESPTERMGIAEALDILGRREKNSQLMQRATQLSIQIADQAPKDLVAQLTAAAQAERMGDAKLAETYYRRSLALDPTNWIANNNLAMIILRAGGNISDAVEYATAAVKSHPRSPNIYDTLAFAQAKSGDAKAASKTIRVALDLSPDNMAYQVRLALYLLDSGQQNEAIAKIREINASGRLLTLDEESQKILNDIRKRVNI